jgi:hypothetical protein
MAYSFNIEDNIDMTKHSTPKANSKEKTFTKLQECIGNL